MFGVLGGRDVKERIHKASGAPKLEALKAWQRLRLRGLHAGPRGSGHFPIGVLLAGSRSRGRRWELCCSAGLLDRSEGCLGVQRIQDCDFR